MLLQNGCFLPHQLLESKTDRSYEVPRAMAKFSPGARLVQFFQLAGDVGILSRQAIPAVISLEAAGGSRATAGAAGAAGALDPGVEAHVAN